MDSCSLCTLAASFERILANGLHQAQSTKVSAHFAHNAGNSNDDRTVLLVIIEFINYLSISAILTSITLELLPLVVKLLLRLSLKLALAVMRAVEVLLALSCWIPKVLKPAQVQLQRRKQINALYKVRMLHKVRMLQGWLRTPLPAPTR
jgi:hypothetical protein